MEVGGINNLRASIINPDFPEDGLAGRAISVSARIVMILDLVAFVANAGVSAKPPSLAVHDGKSGFVLFWRSAVLASEILIEFLENDLHTIIHWRYLQNQMGF
jgi:hypothetical protein